MTSQISNRQAWISKIIYGDVFQQWPDIGAFSLLALLAEDDGVVVNAVAHLSRITGLSEDEWWACVRRLESLGLIEEVQLDTYHTTPRYKIVGFEIERRARMDFIRWRELSAFVFQRDEYTCAYCGERGGKLECDHVIPFSRGGSDSPDNLVTACRTCNRSKRHRTPGEWIGNPARRMAT